MVPCPGELVAVLQHGLTPTSPGPAVSLDLLEAAMSLLPERSLGLPPGFDRCGSIQLPIISLSWMCCFLDMLREDVNLRLNLILHCQEGLLLQIFLKAGKALSSFRVTK